MTENNQNKSKEKTNFNEPIERQATTVLDDVLNKETKSSKPCWRRKRYWFFAFFLVAIWLTLVPSCPRKSLEPRPINGPLASDGERIDYVRYFNESQEAFLQNPDENGFRLVLQAFGPYVLEQWGMAEDCDWDDFLSKPIPDGWKDSLPLDESLVQRRAAARWFQNYWKPLCEKLRIDPKRKPDFFDSYKTLNFFAYIGERGIVGDEKRIEEGDSAGKRIEGNELISYFDRLIQNPWNADENPQAAKWLEEMKPLFDLYAKAIRMPIFVSYHPATDDEDGLAVVLLPDVQVQRELSGRLPAIRANFRIASGDIDGAIDDIETMLYGAKHLCAPESNFFVTVLVGNAIHGVAQKTILNLLKFGDPSEEQLARLAATVRAFSEFIPLKDHPALLTENLLLFDSVRRLLDGTAKQRVRILANLLSEDYLLLQKFPLFLIMPLDSNVVWERVAYWSRRCDEIFQTEDPAERRRLDEKFNEEYQKTTERYKKSVFDPAWLSIRVRSRMVGDMISEMKISATSVLRARTFQQTLNRLTQTAIALDRYLLKNGRYPDSLDALVPDFLPEIPIDPCSMKTPLIYRRTTSQTPSSDANAAETQTNESEETRENAVVETNESNESEIAASVETGTTESPATEHYILYSVGLNLIDDGNPTNRLENNDPNRGDIPFQRFDE